MHPRLSLQQVGFIERSNADFLGFCRAAGIAAAVLATAKLEGGGLDEVRSAFAAGGPRIEALTQLFCRDLSTAGEEAVSGLLAGIDSAAAIGARSLYMLTGGRGPLSWEDAARRFAELIAPCRQVARRHGVELLIENASALYADIHIAHTLGDTIRLAEEAGIGVCIELFHCWAEAGLADSLRRAMPVAGLVQVSDYVLGDRALPARAVPGDGAIPLERILGELLAAGYAGVFDIELVGPRIEAEGAEKAATRAAERVSEILLRLGA